MNNLFIIKKGKSKGDDLTQIKGIGKGTAQKLNRAGIHTYKDLAHADPAQLAKATKASKATVNGWQLDATGHLTEENQGDSGEENK